MSSNSDDKETSKIIHSYVWNPRNSPFKDMKKEAAVHTVVHCRRSGDCELFKRGQCILLATSMLGNPCPHGIKNKETGYTHRSQKFYSWISQKNELKTDVDVELKGAENVIARVGDHVFLPYSFLHLNKSLKMVSTKFIHADEFTVPNIISMIDFRPVTMFGYDEITEYQKVEIPKFLKHLSEVMPAIFGELIKVRPELSIHQATTNVGREALLSSLKPGVGFFVDIYKAQWSWDGKYLTSSNSRASFMLASKFSEVRIKPDSSTVVKVTSDEQVTPETKFIT